MRQRQKDKKTSYQHDTRQRDAREIDASNAITGVNCHPISPTNSEPGLLKTKTSFWLTAPYWLVVQSRTIHNAMLTKFEKGTRQQLQCLPNQITELSAGDVIERGDAKANYSGSLDLPP